MLDTLQIWNGASPAGHALHAPWLHPLAWVGVMLTVCMLDHRCWKLWLWQSRPLRSKTT